MGANGDRAEERLLSCSKLSQWLILSIVVGLTAITCAPASAKQTHLFKENLGSVATPTFVVGNGLAFNQAGADLLVIDAQTQTISRFNLDGTPKDFAALGTNVIDAKGTGQCALVPSDCDQTPQNGFSFTSGVGEQQIAVDNSGSATDGNIYVTQGLQAAGNLVDIFAADGRYLGQLTAAGVEKFGTSGTFPFSPCGVTVDGDGNVYLGGGYDESIYKFGPTANPPVNTDHTATFPTGEQVCNLAAGSGGSASALFANTFFTLNGNSVLKLDINSGAQQYVVDPAEDRLVSIDPTSGHLFAFRRSGEIVEFDVSGPSPVLVSSTPVNGVTGLASAGTSLYVSAPSDGSKQPVKVYGPLVTIPDVATGPAAITGDMSASLHGNVDPDGVALGGCHFEYGLTTAYGTSVPCAESLAEIGTTEKSVHADIASLNAESLYHYRLVAGNVNDTVEGEDKTFKTPGKPTIVSAGSIDVTRAAASLIARISPENSPTTYHFEWGLDTSYGNTTSEFAVGSDTAGHVVIQGLDGLEPGSRYHYRVIASNGIGVTESADHTFTTFPVALPPAVCGNDAFRVGPSAPLPDCRAYEMVSPIDKNGGDIKVLVNLRNFPARLDQASVDGNSMTYSAVPGFGDLQSAPFVSQYLAERGENGWFSQAINPRRESVSLMTNPLRLDAQYKLFSDDLHDGWLFQDADPPLDTCAPGGFINLYRRDNTGSYEALIPNAPTGVTPGSDYRLEVQGVSSDGLRSVFRANAKLTSDAASGNEYQLYEHVGGAGCGELRVLSMTTSGKASSANASAGTGSGPGEYHEGTVARAVSSDATRVFFTLSTSPTNPGTLYLRINAHQDQSPVSAGKCTDSSRGCTLNVSNGQARFWTAATDGSIGVYSIGEELFEYGVSKALAGEPASALIAKNVKGVVGASKDASRIYFVSSDEIEGEGVSGKANLYLYQSGQSGSERYRLVATLDPADLVGFQHSGFSLARPEPIRNGVRVTSDGNHLAFVSTTSLTGYDNTDVADGRPALEVFLYDADADDLACISCNPSNAQPQGREFGPENDVTRRVAAMLAPGETQSFAPRALTEDGNKLFFESFESLLPRDVNETMDVYEWQRAASAAECQEAGAELFAPKSGGCLSLISSGQDEVDSEFADASPDGTDVFIRTASSLVPQDPGQVDVYDVREGGGLPTPVLPGDPCETAGNPAACPGPVPPAPGAQAPASSTDQSSGNVVPKKPKSCPKGKVKNKKGKCVKKGKAHKKKKGKAKNKKGAKRAAAKSGGAGR